MTLLSEQTGPQAMPLDQEERGSVRRWLPIITWEGAFANIFTILTGGAFLTGLALSLKANDFEIGLLAAIPFLAQVAQLASAFLVDRTGARKGITVWFSVLARQSWWLMIPLLFLAGTWRLEAFLAIVVFSSVTLMIATPSWMSWMADLVPGMVRARYFGYRSAALAITTVLATIVGGAVLDRFRNVGYEHAGFAAIVGVGCLFALVAVMLLNRLPDPASPLKKIGLNWSHVAEPLRNRNFRHLLGVASAWNFAIGVSAAFFNAHMLSNLKMSFTQISLYTCVASMAAILLNRPWGIVIDRFKSKPVIVFCAFGISVVPVIWLFPRADFLWILGFEAIYAGTLWTGFNLAVFNVPIANSPKEYRTIYLAMFSVVTGLAFFAASIIGGWLAQTWGYIHWVVGEQTVVNYHILFGISAILRLAAAVLFLTFHEPEEKGLPIMMQYMGNTVLRWLSESRQILPFGTKDR